MLSPSFCTLLSERRNPVTTKLLKIGAFVLALILIFGVCLFANGLLGNPVSKALAKSAAEKHLKKNYSDTDFELGNVSYSFKDGYYHVGVSSPSSIDTHFSLVYDSFGGLRDDYYDYYVKSGWNTATRIDGDYRKAVSALFESKSFPYDAHIAVGEIVFISEEYLDYPEAKDYALQVEKLTIDAFYNTNELGKKHGKLTVYIDTETVSYESMAQILLDIRRCFDEVGIGFYAIDCVLEIPVDSDGFYEDDRINILDFLYSDIYEEGLIERVEDAHRAAEEYYRVLDSEKLGE